jgi:lipoyl(octanoyl) transferase
VESLNCRLLPYAVAAGPFNMAADETLLDSATLGHASLRFYGWSEPTLSLGYFQPHTVRERDPRLASLPFVRRPTGGDAIVHHFELTYALALPAGSPWHGGEPWLIRMHRITLTALGSQGVAASLHEGSVMPPAPDVLCFNEPTRSDVMLAGSKIVGSAQRRRKGALLQHGSILLATSPFAPQLPGIREASGQSVDRGSLERAILDGLSRKERWTIIPGDWTDGEKTRIEELMQTRYTQEGWNRKR